MAGGHSLINCVHAQIARVNLFMLHWQDDWEYRDIHQKRRSRATFLCAARTRVKSGMWYNILRTAIIRIFMCKDFHAMDWPRKDTRTYACIDSCCI